ncbi:beta-galactosidase [Sphingomonas naasensis]|uniref:Beta-galactosidase n=2 Tax=Sphingomonas naasensis TaxID=1344951 RepID=A0A4S1WT35_9SPHN|nr:beta-galactosidase [Sphingomonas naasensis]
MAWLVGASAATLLAGALPAQEAPRIVTRDGRHALFVDGAPFLMLGAQANNSSNYPAMLPKVWPVVEAMHANTLEIPIAWEQVEPVEGQFDFAFLDTLIEQARAHKLRLVLLWFATWKNTGNSYAPEWVKRDTGRFPRMRKPDGATHYALSPHGRNTLEADKRAFVAMMKHLARIDRDHTVIMVQPENEAGSYELARDHAPEAERLFRGAVPAELVRALKVKPGSWTAVFGKRAEQYFQTWHLARYIDEIAAAGKAVKPLPMYVNAALGDAFTDEGGNVGPSGGPNWNVIPVWKTAAPHIDLVAPDIYKRDALAVESLLDKYAQRDNALMVPEIGNALDYARFLWPALGRGAIGFAPFGMDATGFFNYPLGAKALDPATMEAFAGPYAMLAPMAGDWARIAFENPVWGTAKGAKAQSTVLGRWRIAAEYGQWQMGEPGWTSWIKMDRPPLAEAPVGGMVVAQLGPDTFLISGSHVRVRLSPVNAAPGEQAQLISAEEGSFVAGKWTMRRRWNGDQIDYGLNFTGEPVMLKVTMGLYR